MVSPASDGWTGTWLGTFHLDPGEMLAKKRYKKKKTPRVDGQKEPEKLIKILDMSITSGDDMSSTSRKS